MCCLAVWCSDSSSLPIMKRFTCKFSVDWHTIVALAWREETDNNAVVQNFLKTPLKKSVDYFEVIWNFHFQCFERRILFSISQNSFRRCGEINEWIYVHCWKKYYRMFSCVDRILACLDCVFKNAYKNCRTYALLSLHLLYLMNLCAYIAIFSSVSWLEQCIF